MINCTKLPPRMICNYCDNIQNIDSTHCSACGKSFIFGEEDAWKSGSYSARTYENFAPIVDDEIDKEIDEFFAKSIKRNNKILTDILDGSLMDADIAKIINDNFMDLLDDAK